MIHICSLVFAFILALFSVARTDTNIGSLSVVQEQNSISFKCDGTEIVSFTYQDSLFKPYIKRLLTPGGIDILLDSPPDHKHHHGLMYALTIDGTTFWAEYDSSGRQQVKNLELISRPFGPGVQCDILWKTQNEKLMAKEVRTIVFQDSPDVRLLTWITELQAPASGEAIILSGSPYHGLGMRFIRAMDENGRFFTAENRTGPIFRGEERLTRDRWCAYTASVAEQKVTVAMFGHPNNPRGETLWFTMKTPFAYLSATLGLHEESLELAPGRQLQLAYGMALWDGEQSTETIEATYKKWLKTFQN